MFKSKAQRQFCLEQVKAGKIAQATFDKWDSESDEDLPTRLTPKLLKKAALKPVKKAKVIK